MRAFYGLSAVQIISFTGSAMTGIAIGIWLFQQTSDVTPVLLVAFFSSLPGLAAGALSGVLIDRWDKRRILILADTGQAAGTLILLIALLSGHFTLWLLYGVVIWQSLCGMFPPPTMMALITGLVAENRRERANAIHQSMHRMAGILAPGLAGLLYALTGLAGILLIDFATFLTAVFVTRRIVPSQKPALAKNPPQQRSMRREMLEGFRFLRTQRGLFGLILHGTIINFFLSSVLALTTPYTLRLTNSEAATGFILSALNAGALAGAVIIGIWGGTRPRIHTIMPAILVISLAVMGYGMAQTLPALTITAFLMLLPMPFVTALIPAILQQRTPPELQGRVFAVMFQLASLANPLSLLLTGFLIDNVLSTNEFFDMAGRSTLRPYDLRLHLELMLAVPGAGMRLFIVVSGTAMLVVTLGFYASPTIRQFESSDS